MERWATRYFSVSAPTTTAADPTQIARNAVRNTSQLATLPEITQRIITAVEDPRSSAGQLHKIISHDPALVTRVLKIVNSAFYGIPGQIASIERAIVLLGLNAVKNLAVASSLGQLFRKTKLYSGADAKDLWKHCVAVAVASRELAVAAKLPLAEQAFLAGLIHDVGILVELQNWPEKLRTVCESADKGGDFCVIEQEKLGVDHQIVGRILAEQWKFPKICQDVAGCHHQPCDAPEESRALVNIVYVADTLCCQQGEGFSLTARNQSFDLPALEATGISAETLSTVTASLRDKVADAWTGMA